MADARPRLDALTGVRFIGALQVMVFHFWKELGQNRAPALHKLILSAYVSLGLFFVLSGFILTVLYGQRDLSGDARRDFWAARVAKIAPSYLLGWLLWLPLAVGQHTDPVAGFLALLGLQAWHPSYALAWNYPAWSVSVEIACYAAFPFVLPLVLRLGRRGTWGLLAGAWAAALVVPTIYLALVPGPADYTMDTGPLAVVRYCPALRFPEFVMGMALGRLWHLGELEAPRWFGFASAVAMVAGLVVSHRLPFILLHNGLLDPLLIALIAALTSPRDPLARALSWRPLVILGDASYCTYILHAPIVWLIRESARAHGVTNPWLSCELPAAAIAVSLALSVLVMYVLENPARRWLRRRLGSAAHAARVHVARAA